MSFTPHINRILIVDDLEANRFTLRMMLETLSVFEELSITEAVDGFGALEKLRTQEFDLVLLDVMMPQMSGVDLLEAYIEPDNIRQPPIVMVSALSETETVAKAISLGAIDYLTKPINRRLLSARVTSALKHRRLIEEISSHRGRMERELNAAADLQRSLCPAQLPSSGAEMAGILRPALEVGGDFYDAFELQDGSTITVVSDVCDKGMPAALFTMRVRDVIKTASRNMTWDNHPASAQELMTTANQIISAVNPGDIFVATCIIHFHPTSGTARICNAGLPPPLLHREQGMEQATNRHNGQLTVGILPDFEYNMNTVRLEQGDWLFAFTDGIEDLENATGQKFNAAGLAALLGSQDRTSSADHRISALEAAIDRFQGDTNQVDDITLVALKKT